MNVCVIGAGAAGLVAIRRIKSTVGFSGTVYEQSSDIGGIWCYRETDEPAVKAVSPMYKNLRYFYLLIVIVCRYFAFCSVLSAHLILCYF